MCGILGLASTRPIITDSLLIKLKEGLTSLSHRGPDDEGYWVSNNRSIFLGHRRLSIIDLSAAGHQPMFDSQKNISIIFNGEIYNFHEIRKTLIEKSYSFNSQSDTEVIISAYKEWGINCLNYFNGMFSFAIYDKLKNELFIARDRAGEKPLFYNLSNGTLRFSSELKAILKDNSLDRKINTTSLNTFLSYGYVPGERCILEGFHKLPPAHYLLFDLSTGQLKVNRYWSIPDFDATLSFKEDELLFNLEKLIEDSVRKQLVADVPIGILLSGGVDSSIVTAMASRSSSKIKTFTVSFPGHKKFDETPHANMIAQHFNTDHNVIEASSVTVDLLPLLARQFDEPIADSSMIPTYLVSKLIREHCTVALGGDGGDELFGGYQHHSRLIYMFSKLKHIPQFIRQPVGTLSKYLPSGFKGKSWLNNMGVDLEKGLPMIATLFDSRTKANLLGALNLSYNIEQIMKTRIPDELDLVQRVTRMDFNNYLPEDILVKVDRSSMLNSLEIRAPFLDYRIIEFAYRNIPSNLKTTVSQRKIILKLLCKKLLPKEFDIQRKQGFGIPIGTWIRKGPWRDFFYETLISQNATGFMDALTIKNLLRNHDKGHNNTERLFSLIMLELWRKEYNISI